ncbi:hypothetical protein ACWDZ8_01050 [Streptomyces sp. NPDC003233]
MPEHPWFVIEAEDDEEFEFADDERAFAAALRERTAGWPRQGSAESSRRRTRGIRWWPICPSAIPGAGSICSTPVCTSPGTASAETVCTTSCSP